MKYTYSYTPAAGPKSSPYVFSCIFVGSEELQWYASKYANCNGVSPKFENYNGMNQNIFFYIYIGARVFGRRLGRRGCDVPVPVVPYRWAPEIIFSK